MGGPREGVAAEGGRRGSGTFFARISVRYFRCFRNTLLLERAPGS